MGQHPPCGQELWDLALAQGFEPVLNPGKTSLSIGAGLKGCVSNSQVCEKAGQNYVLSHVPAPGEQHRLDKPTLIVSSVE